MTAGKDKKIEQWDADKFEHIQTLETKDAEAAPVVKKTIEIVKAAELVMEALELPILSLWPLETFLRLARPASLFNRYVQYSLEVELVCRCLFFLLRVHFGQISSNQMLLTVIDELRTNTISKVREFRDVLGFNSTGLQFLQRKVESKEDVIFFANAASRRSERESYTHHCLNHHRNQRNHRLFISISIALAL
ncbi:hypothetical protein J4Q44_G00196600 [Coregonus suidteri]|uniref:Small-subunit processome Utp12 domain-containing protein n=1 Tax=Coregonus suidteri TaxID=861788 RepID=A0AAN8LHH1_9TELE